MQKSNFNSATKPKMRWLLSLVVFIGMAISANAQYIVTNLTTQNFGTLVTGITLPTGFSSSGNNWTIINTAGANSTGYTGASGNAHARTTAATTTAKELIYNNSLSTVGYGSIKIIWGARRSVGDNGALPSSVFEWSSDGSVWNSVSYTAVATNDVWALVNGGVKISLPAGAEGVSNLRLRWTITPTVVTSAQSRIDDIIVEGTPTPTITSLGASTNCPGVNLVINGTNFDGVTTSDVTVGGTPVTSIVSNTGTVLTVITAIGSAGNVNVTTPGGTASFNGYTTIVDNTAPVITCPSNINHTADAGVCNANLSVGTATATDNCSATVSGVRSDAAALSAVYPVGTTTITWTAIDYTGNTSTCLQTIIVTDNEAPSVTCAGAVSINTNAGVCTGTTTLTSPTNGDNCGVLSVTNDHVSTTYSLGTTIVLWTVTDIHGNSSTCNQSVTVTDNELPVITFCPVGITQTADAGVCGAMLSVGVATATDNCTVSVVGVRSDAGLLAALYPVGLTTITWTATDGSGNTATCSQAINISDDEIPSITCAGDQSQSVDAGLCGATVTVTGPATADNCAIDFVLNDYNGSSDASDDYIVGTTTVNWLVADVNGNLNSCSQDITVVDDEAPQIICASLPLVQTADFGSCGANVTVPELLVGVDVFDNCGVLSIVNDHNGGGADASGFYIVGTTTVTYIVTDIHGNTSSCSEDITVEDDENPSIVCAANVSVNNDAGLCSATVILTAPSTSDNCLVSSVTNDYSGGSTYPVGTTNVIWTVVDNHGNNNQCLQTVTVTDNEAPSITCAPSQTQTADAGVCTAVVSVVAPATGDNCGVLTTVSSHPSSTYPVGTTTVTWTVTDIHGNASTCNQSVTVTDNEAPVITCAPSQTQTADAGVCTAVVSVVAPATGDNCGVLSTVSSHPSSTYPVGTTTVTWTVTDIHGNTNSCSHDITVTDNEAPSVTCGGTISVFNTTGACSASVTVTSPTTGDNCGVATVTNDYTFSSNASGTYIVGTTHVLWTVTDIHGNVSTCNQDITVVDNEAPIITCPVTATISANAGLCTSNLSIGTATATDNCAIINSITHSPVGPYPVGFTTVTWTALDSHGNTSTCSQTVHVTDNENPVITCPGIANISADAGLCTSSASIGTATATDNCAGTVISHLPVGPYAVGSTVVTWRATDASGNTSTCNQTVVVTDNEAPVITCNGGTVFGNSELGLCAATVTVALPTISDNCGGTLIYENDFNHLQDASDAYPVGTTIITWTITDIHGNTSSCSQLVTITDVEAPTITCGANVSINAASGLCTAVATVLSPVTDDNCFVASVTNDFNSTANASGTYPVGINTVIWTVTDIHGNTNSCAQTVTIIDNQNPTILAPGPITVCSITTGVTVSLGTPTGADNCGGVTYTNDAPGTYPFGTTLVTWVAHDLHGNTAISIQAVTINPTPVGTSSLTNICSGQSPNLDLTLAPLALGGSTSFTWTAANTVGVVVGFNNCTGSCGSMITDVLSNLGVVHGDVDYTITPTSNLGCVGATYIATIEVGVSPHTGVITGPTVLCGMTTAHYSIAPVIDATGYIWTVPSGLLGMTIVSGQGTTAIDVSFYVAIAPGDVTVTSFNTCFPGNTQTLHYTRRPDVPLLTTASGNLHLVCGATTATFHVDVATFGATSYTWGMPTGMTIVGPSTTSSITVSFASTFTQGNITIAANNACGSTYGAQFTVNHGVPATPGILSGPTNVCGLTTATYSIPAVAYATGYTWTVPAWMTIQTGLGTTSITVDMVPPPIMPSGAQGQISVTSTNNCGPQLIPRTINLSLAAIIPGAITGPASLCGVTTATYSVADVTPLQALPGGQYTYNWALAVTGWSITSGQGTTQITATGPGAGTSGTGIVKVTSTNGCGNTSGIRTKGITYCHSSIANNNSTTEEGTNNMFSQVYPNPASGEFKIDVTTDMDREITVQVYDVLGNLLVSEKHQIAAGTSTMNTNVENYKTGMYFVRLIDSNATTVYSQTVLKQ